MIKNVIKLAETGLIPDSLIRLGIRKLLAKRLQKPPLEDSTQHTAVVANFANRLANGPLAVATDTANRQHYEVPAEFFTQVLGPRLKYSSCYFPNPLTELADAEDEMLGQTCARAEIADGMRILELGCGWGSLTFWIAEQFPNCQITAVSNSTSQRRFIENRASSHGFHHVRVITADMREFALDEKFDRIVSVEMFEHMHNYAVLFRRLSDWLTPDGKAFIHIFCHRHTPYLFETEGASNWMGRYFFTGGTMPSEDLFRHFDADLAIERQWRVNGLHYWRTCEAWLRNLDRHRAVILARFCDDLNRREAKKNLQRWRIFFMACAELFRYCGGAEWFVAHYLFQRAAAKSPGNRMACDEQKRKFLLTASEPEPGPDWTMTHNHYPTQRINK